MKLLHGPIFPYGTTATIWLSTTCPIDPWNPSIGRWMCEEGIHLPSCVGNHCLKPKNRAERRTPQLLSHEIQIIEGQNFTVLLHSSLARKIELEVGKRLNFSSMLFQGNSRRKKAFSSNNPLPRFDWLSLLLLSAPWGSIIKSREGAKVYARQ